MDIDSLAGQVLDWVRDADATGDLIIDEGESLSLKARDGALEEHKVSSSQVFGLRVIKDDRVGTAYSEAADADALRSMVDQALVNASFARPEHHEKILPLEAELRTDDSLLCPPDAAGVEEKIDAALTLETRLAARDKVKNVPYNGVSDNTGQRRVFTTAGLTAFSRSRMCSAMAFALMEEGEKNVMDGFGQASRIFGEIDIDAIIEQAHKNCTGLLHGEPVESGHYDVVFDKETQADLFGVFDMMFSGKSAKDGVNPMRDKVGEQIADPRLSFLDIPLNADGFGYSLFDAEGTPTGNRAFIHEGRLETLAHNSATAAHFGVKTTGHAARGPRSTLGVGLHQYEVAAGPDADVLAGTYLEITDLTGLHSGANPIAGDFSFGASGYLCRDGARQQPVRGITVAGNFYEMLKQIAAIGTEQFWNWQRHALMPHVRFAGIAVSG